MNKLFSSENLLSAFPLAADENQLALATVTAEELSELYEENNLTALYTRINELNEDLLDILAYDFKIDWWNDNYSIEEKRATFLGAMAVHRHLGTIHSVEIALGAVFPGTRIKEWFEYGGKPYHFRLEMDVTQSGLTEVKQNEVLAKVRFYKNLRSRLEGLRYKTERNISVKCGAYCTIGQVLEINPYAQAEMNEEG